MAERLRHVVGIDAGGTKTVGLLADETGKVLAEARSGAANLKVNGELGVEKVLYGVIDELDPRVTVFATCIGIAGFHSAADRQVVRAILRRLGLRRGLRIEPDAMIALVAGSPERRGIVVIAGTGSIAYGVDENGKAVKAGGWGYLLGDEGSGFWLGHAALRLAIRGADGRGPATLLGDLLARRLELDVPEGLVNWFYDPELSRFRVAELASLVEEAAAAGDLAADALLDDAAGHLARAAQAVARQLTFHEPYRLVMSGGAFRACPSLLSRLEARLELPDARPALLTEQPARGAVTLALDLLRNSGKR